MKYAALQAAKLLLLAVLAVLLWGILHADPQQADFSVLREQAEQAMDLTGMRQADAQLLRRLYGLNGGELAGWALWTSEDNMAVRSCFWQSAYRRLRQSRCGRLWKPAGAPRSRILKATGRNRCGSLRTASWRFGASMCFSWYQSRRGR